MPIKTITRRKLLGALTVTGLTATGSGLYLAIWTAGERRWAKAVQREQAFAPSVFLAIDEDDRITIWLTKTEMGQGVMTALPLLIAEELDADWAKVQVNLAPLDSQHDYGSMFTAASASVTSLWSELRKAGAAAREMIVSAAAEHFGISDNECSTSRSFVTNTLTSERISYGALARRAARLKAPLLPTLKQASDFRLIGQDIQRVDIPSKVDGSAQYGIDVHIDGAVWVKMRRCPFSDGQLVSFDASKAMAVPGVKKVARIENAVAVAADSTWSAQQGALALNPQWRRLDSNIDTDDFNSKLVALSQTPGLAVVTADDNDKLNHPMLSCNYFVPFLAHAPMEPLNSTVRITDRVCEVWVSTQNPEAVRDRVAAILTWPVERVIIHRTLAGGGFGRRTQTDESEEAVRAALAFSLPVHLIWSREDDIQHDFYRESVAHTLSGRLSSDGSLLHLKHRIASSSAQPRPEAATQADAMAIMGATDLPYSSARLTVEWHGLKSPLRVGIWRSVGYSHNTFALESFVDELAQQHDIDPLELRLKLMPQDSPLKRCLLKVKEMSRWDEQRAAGAALGVAICSCFGSHIAQVIQVEALPAGSFRVLQVWSAIHCGLAIQPDNIVSQCEGGTIFGLTAALLGRIDVHEGAVVQSNFHDYPLLRQSQTPNIEVFILPSLDPPSGVGELAVPPVAPALCNALFQLTGQRHRNLPLLA